jgi:hypothetical protein
MEVDATTSFQREVSSSGSVQNTIFCIAAERSRTYLIRAVWIGKNASKCSQHTEGKGQQVWAIYMEVDANTSFQREVSSSGSVQNTIFCVAAERSRTSLTRALVIDENTIKCAPHIREKGQQVLASDMEVEVNTGIQRGAV